MEKVISIFLAVVVVIVCAYFIATSSWFDLNPCPEGTRVVETVWNAGTPNERTDRMCVEGEEYT